MKISTIIPVYNAENYIRRCLDSILSQKIEGQEIICVDDGSTDHSLEILMDYEKNYDNVHVLTQRNSYAGVARNNGLSVAKGEYVHFMDADDYVLPGSYSRVYKNARENSADYVKTKSKVFDMNTGAMLQNDYFSMDDITDDVYGKIYSFIDCQEILLKTARAPWTSFVKRNYLVENNIRFNSLKCVNDHSFYIDVITHTNRILLCNCYMVCYQTNNKESLMGIRSENFVCHIKSYQLIRNIVSDISENLRKKILGFEFSSLARWYAKLNMIQREEIKDILKLFMEDFDWAELDVSLLTAEVTDPICEFINMKIPDKCRIKNPYDLERIFINSHHLILYGAGKVCLAVVQYLEKKNYDLNRIFSILVSDKVCNPVHVNGIPVYSAEEYEIKSGSEIIIATLENVQFPIYQMLSMEDFDNIWTVSNDLYQLL